MKVNSELPSGSVLDGPAYPQIDRRAGLSIREFNRDYRAAKKPVVIVDAIEDWRARTAWTLDFFKSRYGSTKVLAYRYRGDKYNQKDAVQMSFGDYLDGVSSGDWNSFPYYIRDNWALLLSHLELAEDYKFPKYFYDWFSLLPPFMRLRYPRIFIGPKGAVTPLHEDIWRTHAWLSQLVGRKRWIFFPPEQRHLLYDHQVDPARPDLKRFPLYSQAQPLECTLAPGETVFVPGGWAHWVVSLDATISLTSNYMGPGAFWVPLTSATKELLLGRLWNAGTQLLGRSNPEAKTAQR
jgi:histone arginine demethylase JMJD6